jgi:hypothetical protein
MIWHLLKEFNSMSRDDQASSLPFCIAENVTLKQFHAKCDRNDSSGCYWWEFKDGEVWIYEFPHTAHARAAGEVTFQLRVQMGQHMNDIISAASPRCDNNAKNWSSEPDGSLTVMNSRPGRGHADAADQFGNRWPNIIVEVAFRESETHVLAKAIDWLETATDPNNGVQQVIVIKIGMTVPSGGSRTIRRGGMSVAQLQTWYRQSNLGITVLTTEPLKLGLLECSFISRWRVCTSRMPHQLT